MMSKTNLVKALLLGLIVAGALLFALYQRPSRPVAVGDVAPDFTLPSLTSGSVSLRDHRQQVVVLHFWATWCPPCVEEVPALRRFAEQIQGEGVTVISVSVDQDTAALQKFVAETRLSFPIARDPDRTVATRYGTFQFPETYFINRDGRVAGKVPGWVDWQDLRIINFVQELARGSPHQGK
jgi:cytochrome c biogenesis protein CcmG/thiol:disulfide interchange protein DsbE